MQNHPLTAARERLGLTRRQLADAVNKILYPDPGQAAHSAFTANYLGKLENGKIRYPADDYRTAAVDVIRYGALLDATDEGALRQLGLTNLPRVVVAIGASVEASVLTVLALVELGVPQIWARATSGQHAKILSSVGAHRVIFPEAETGERLAHLIISRMLDFVEFGEAFAVARDKPDGTIKVAVVAQA